MEQQHPQVVQVVQVAQPNAGWQSTMSKEFPNEKRTAEAADMDPPDEQLATEKAKLDTPLEARLTQLQQVLGPGNLVITWKNYDPDCFMEEMRRLSNRINALTPTTVGKYLTDERLEEDLLSLNIQEMDLRGPIDPVKLKRPELAPTIREQMFKYVARVRTHLNALVEQASVKSPARSPPNLPGSLPPLKQSPKLGEDEIQDLISSYTEDVMPFIRQYLEKNTRLPIWDPPAKLPNDIREYLRNLGIPRLSHSSNYPCLLVHNLGEDDSVLLQRVNSLFNGGSSKIKLLCNTSGSGKTRLLFEALCLFWGLYFTACTEPEGVGSVDLQQILETLEHTVRLAIITDDNQSTALGANVDVASRRFLSVLYARLLIFHLFLECASSMPGGLTDEHKSRWLLLQIAPKVLLTRDIFAELTQILQPASLQHLFSGIEKERNAITRLLKAELFCVLDEAQVPTEMGSRFFRSGNIPSVPRPLLRQLIQDWNACHLTLILSGTGVSREEMETVIVSLVAKEGDQVETFTNLGAFDSWEDQYKYVARYLPPRLLNGDRGEKLKFRVAYWLHGRYRFTATWISRLLRTGFQRPHYVLDCFVEGMTGFRPSDADSIDDGSSTFSQILELEPPRAFNFSKLEKDEALLRQIAGCIFDYIFHGNQRDTGSREADKLVEYGVARFGGLKNLVTDEPLALLAAIRSFNKTPWSLNYFLNEALSHSYPSARGVALEHFGAYILALAFKSPRRLGEVFKLVGSNDLEQETGRLVALHKQNGAFVAHPVDITSDSLPTYILGRSPPDAQQTLTWLEDPGRAVFCFPAHIIKPDLILLLQLSDMRLLRVLVQFKQKQMGTISPAETLNALESIDPRTMNSRLDSTPQMNREITSTQLQTAITNLGEGTDKAGELGVLRVLIAHPATFNKEALSTAQVLDPTATVDLATLAKEYSEESALQSLQLRLEAAAKNEKREEREERALKS